MENLCKSAETLPFRMGKRKNVGSSGSSTAPGPPAPSSRQPDLLGDNPACPRKSVSLPPTSDSQETSKSLMGFAIFEPTLPEATSAPPIVHAAEIQLNVPAPPQSLASTGPPAPLVSLTAGQTMTPSPVDPAERNPEVSLSGETLVAVGPKPKEGVLPPPSATGKTPPAPPTMPLPETVPSSPSVQSTIESLIETELARLNTLDPPPDMVTVMSEWIFYTTKAQALSCFMAAAVGERTGAAPSELGRLLTSSLSPLVPNPGTAPPRPRYTLEELAARDELIQSYRRDAERQESILNERIVQLNSRLSSTRAQVLHLEENLRTERQALSRASWDARIAQEAEAHYKSFLADQVPLLRKSTFKEAAEIFLKKLAATYPDADMAYFRNAADVPAVDIPSWWVDFFAEGAPRT